MRRQSTALILSVVCFTAAVSSADAADLDRPIPRPRVIAGVDADLVAPQALPRCRTIAAPEFNLSYEVARYRPQTICYSRGLLADQMP